LGREEDGWIGFPAGTGGLSLHHFEYATGFISQPSSCLGNCLKLLSGKADILLKLTNSLTQN
jgi:hypothetical protein